MVLTATLDRLAAFEPSPFPVVSLYLDTQPNQRGRDDYRRFLRKELPERVATFRAGSTERDSLERDFDRIRRYLDSDVNASANSLAIFACHGSDLFEALQLTAPIDGHLLVVSDQPHLYPLARINDQYPRYAALLADTNRARLFVFSTGELERRHEVQNLKTHRVKVGGWSQARYQRHVDQYHLLHVKEVVDVLDRIVRAERIQSIIIAGDEVVVPLIRDQLPRHLTERVIDVIRLDITTPEHDVLAATLDVLRRRDAQSDRHKVEAMLDAYRAGGLAVVGAAPTLQALANGQVDEVLITADPRAVRAESGTETAAASAAAEKTTPAALADRIVVLGQQTGARITFIEDRALLAGVGGVGALLRYRIRHGGRTAHDLDDSRGGGPAGFRHDSA